MSRRSQAQPSLRLLSARRLRLSPFPLSNCKRWLSKRRDLLAEVRLAFVHAALPPLGLFFHPYSLAERCLARPLPAQPPPLFAVRWANDASRLASVFDQPP